MVWWTGKSPKYSCFDITTGDEEARNIVPFWGYQTSLTI